MRAIINNRYKSKLLGKSEQRIGKVKATKAQNEVGKSLRKLCSTASARPSVWHNRKMYENYISVPHLVLSNQKRCSQCQCQCSLMSVSAQAPVVTLNDKPTCCCLPMNSLKKLTKQAINNVWQQLQRELLSIFPRCSTKSINFQGQGAEQPENINRNCLFPPHPVIAPQQSHKSHFCL